MAEPARAAAVFAAAASAEIAGIYLVWRGFHARARHASVLAGLSLLVLYGVLVGAQRGYPFGQALSAYGGVFILGVLVCATVFDGYRPRLTDVIGAALCLVGVCVLIATPRGRS